jgi:hypothetical protein
MALSLSAMIIMVEAATTAVIASTSIIAMTSIIWTESRPQQ